MPTRKRPIDDNIDHYTVNGIAVARRSKSTARDCSEDVQPPASSEFEMTEHSRRKLKRFSADCTVQTSDGVEFRLSKSFLSAHSDVLGDMIQALSAESIFTITEDGETFNFLLDAICAKGNKQPPINMANVESIMEGARKYDIDLHYACDRVVAKHLKMHPIKVTPHFPDYTDYLKYHTWADTYELERTSHICCKFAARNFMRLGQNFGPNWQTRFGNLEQKGIMEARVKALHKRYKVACDDL